MKIAVMGTGGVGGYFGGLLARKGHQVTYIARGAHMSAINGLGLRVESQLDGEFSAPGKAMDRPAPAGFQDLILFTVKMYHNASAIDTIRPLVGPNTVVLTLQNGIDNGDQLSEAFGHDLVMIGSVYMEGRIKEPGVVTQGGPGMAVFGEMEPGITPRGQRLLNEFQDAGWRVNLADNMPGMLWKKFAYIAGSAAVNAATDTGYAEMRTIPETRELVRATIEEALSVGRALGSPIMEDSMEWAMTSLDNFPAQGRASLAKDFQEGRPQRARSRTGHTVRLR